MLPAELIGELTQRPQRGGTLPEHLPGLIADGVDDKVRMDMCRILMGGDQDFAFRPSLLCKLTGKTVSFHGRDVFPW